MRRSFHKLNALMMAVLSFLVLLATPVAGSAASPPTYSVNISSIATDDFPLIRFHFSPRDIDHTIVEELTIDNIYLTEDGVKQLLDRMVLTEPGLQVIVAINPGPAINYYVGGKSRFENLRLALLDYLSTQSNRENDDFSLVTAAQPLASRLADPAEISLLLSEFNPAWASISPSLDSLTAALELTSLQNPKPDMKRAILYITPLTGNGSLNDLDALTTQAASAGVHVFVWLVAYNSASTSQETSALKELAYRTNGDFFLYTGVEALPDPNILFEPLRFFYKGEYTSGISESGAHAISLVMQTNSGEIHSAPVTFNLSILPPSVSLINPPESITRTQVSDQPLEELRLDYLIQFPDGYARDIRSVRLLVDGVQTLTDVDEPFDFFLWSPPADLLAESHTLKLSVTDELGITATSSEITIGIELQTAARTMLQQWLSNLKGTRLIILIAVAISAAALITVLILSSRGYRLKLGGRPSRKEQRDPCTQRVPISIEAGKPTSAVPARANKIGNSSYAQLVPLTSAGQINTLIRPYVLSHEEYVIGSDAKQVDIQVKSTSVEPIHSRLINKGELGIFASDCHTKSGTWVNYTPVSETGTRLEHNDIISFGKIAYRFELIRQPGNNSD